MLVPSIVMHRATATLVVCSAAISLLVLIRTHRRRHKEALGPPVLCPSAPDFATWACKHLHTHGYARIRLTPAQSTKVTELFCDAASFFASPEAARDSHVPPPERQHIDSRNGYVFERGREFMELHPRAGNATLPSTATPSAALFRSGASLSAAFHDVCEEVLRALAASNAAVATLLDAECEGRGAEHGDTFSASMLRVHQYTEDTEYPAHCDLGLLTLAPRATLPGLLVQDGGRGEWVAVEELMGSDEAILFAGSTLAEMGGPAPLPHKVSRQGAPRLSAPYFCRASPHVPMPQLAVAPLAALHARAHHGAMPEATPVTKPAPRSVGAFVAQLNEARRDAHLRAVQLVWPQQAQQAQQALRDPPSLGSSLGSAAPPVAASPMLAPTGGAVEPEPADVKPEPAAVEPEPTAVEPEPSDGSTAHALLPVVVDAPVTTLPPSAVAMPVAAPAIPGVPARVRACFTRLDADADGRISLEDLAAGFAIELYGAEGALPAAARTALDELFAASAIGDWSFGERYADKRLFVALYANMLFMRHDADGDGRLTHAEAQAALKFLARPPKDGTPKPDVHFACPADAYDAQTGELRMGREWFWQLFLVLP